MQIKLCILYFSGMFHVSMALLSNAASSLQWCRIFKLQFLQLHFLAFHQFLFIVIYIIRLLFGSLKKNFFVFFFKITFLPFPFHCRSFQNHSVQHPNHRCCSPHHCPCSCPAWNGLSIYEAEKNRINFNNGFPQFMTFPSCLVPPLLVPSVSFGVTFSVPFPAGLLIFLFAMLLHPATPATAFKKIAPTPFQ